ncbi:MAG: hypothetical protein V3V00_14770, partial [Saprospiraceae bacterium]
CTLCLLEISVVIVGPFHKIGIFILRPICHNPLILWFHAWLSEYGSLSLLIPPWSVVGKQV